MLSHTGERGASARVPFLLTGIAMAVAEKNKQDITTGGLLDRLSAGVLAGTAYVYGCLGIIFPGLNSLWWHYLGFDRNNPVAWVSLLTVGSLLTLVLGYTGLVLLGPRPTRGLRAGIFFAATGLGLIALLGVYLGALIENALYVRSWFGPADRTWGIGAAAVLVGVLLLGGLYLLVQPWTEKFFGTVEDQGWFSWESYKRSQGQRVRRGTIIGILLLAGFGLRSLNQTLERDPGDWVLNIPFTGVVKVTAFTAGDNLQLFGNLVQSEWAFLEKEADLLQNTVQTNDVLSGLRDQAKRVVEEVQKRDNLEAARKQLKELRQGIEEQAPDAVPDEEAIARDGPAQEEIERFALRDVNLEFQKEYTKIESPGFPGNEEPKPRVFKKGEIVRKGDVQTENIRRAELRKKLEEKGEYDPITTPIEPAKTVAEVAGTTGTTQYYTLTLLPHVQYTIPLLLAVLALWVVWRLVNLPAFADFLIATEAELNKVSWVTRRQLFQDTIVVLVTVVLMTVFLLLADIGWSQFLKGIGVLHPGQGRSQQQAEQELKW